MIRFYGGSRAIQLEEIYQAELVNADHLTMHLR